MVQAFAAWAKNGNILGKNCADMLHKFFHSLQMLSGKPSSSTSNPSSISHLPAARTKKSMVYMRLPPSSSKDTKINTKIGYDRRCKGNKIYT
jgi:hypothetical protein